MNLKQELIENLIKDKAESSTDLALIKRKTAKKYKSACPSNISLLKVYHGLVDKKRVKPSKKIEQLLKTRPVRSISGIVNVSVLTKPYSCPGKCLFCPQEKNIPKSYLSGEPAVERAKKLNFNPYQQTQKRIEMLEKQGHTTDKIELRIIGGTWSYYPKKYQQWFVARCFQAANQFNGKKSKLSSLFTEQKKNEKAKHRIIGLSVETRPDFINQAEIKNLRKIGATMVELGVQSIYDHVLDINNREHQVQETIKATKLLKDAGFKVLYQIMPNLLGSDLKKDKQMFKKLFSNQNFQPDLLKIYPCVLLKTTGLYKVWQKNKYQPYQEKQLINLIKSIKKIIPCYVRIQRISRDIPSNLIVAGPAQISNLRQILAINMEKNNWQCQCIRCREIKEKYNPKEKLYLARKNYLASQGKEIFLSFKDKNNKLYSLLRLRINSNNQAIIREIHTYGPVVSISEKKSAPQHQGLGKKLINQAEKITKQEFKLNKISVIAGVGARNYFRKLGYKLKNSYMVKKI